MLAPALSQVAQWGQMADSQPYNSTAQAQDVTELPLQRPLWRSSP